MKQNDLLPSEERANELANLAAAFYRKCIANDLIPLVALDLARTYLQTLMLQDMGKPPIEPWQKP